MEFGDRSRLEGTLEKKSRDRHFMSISNWQTRHFILEKHTLTYYNPRDLKKPLGSVITKGAQVAKVHPNDAEGKKFAFVINTTSANPDGEESFILNADSESLRNKWMNYIYASTKSENWVVKVSAVQKKTGQDISTALLSKKKEQDVDKEDGASLLLTSLSSSLLKKKFQEEEKQLENSLRIIAATKDEQTAKTTTGNGGQVDAEGAKISERNFNKMQDLLNLTKRNHAATRIQSFLRRKIVANRKYLRMYFAQCVLLLQTQTRTWLAKRHAMRMKIERVARSVIGKLVCRYRAAKHELHKLHTTGQIFTVETTSAAGLVSKSVSANIFVYTMSCYDDSKRFKGKDETNVKNGYGLKSTSLHKSRSLAYSHDPDWEDEENRAAPAFTIGTTSNHFFVITIMAYDTILGTDSFVGQAIVSMQDHAPGAVIPEVDPSHPNRRLPKVKTVADALYAGEELVFHEYPLIKYVAPVEDTKGVAVVVLNVAMQIRQVTGSVCFKIKIQNPLKCMTEKLSKETNALFAQFSSANHWKERLFVLTEGYLVYAKHDCDFGAEEKHSAKLSKAVEFKLIPYDKKNPQKFEIKLVFKENKIAKPEVWTIRWPDETPIRQRKLLVRKLYRTMTQFVDDEAQRARGKFMGDSKTANTTLVNMLGSVKGGSVLSVREPRRASLREEQEQLAGMSMKSTKSDKKWSIF